MNTADDLPFGASGACAAGPECITLPGPDGTLGTPDDTSLSLANFQRQIQIGTVLQTGRDDQSQSQADYRNRQLRHRRIQHPSRLYGERTDFGLPIKIWEW